MYSLLTAFYHLIIALLLFFLVNWIGSHSKPLGYVQLSVIELDDTYPVFNLLFKVLAPVVAMVLIGALAQRLGFVAILNNLYMVVVMYWIIRTMYIIIFSRVRLINWTTQIIYWTISVGLAIWISSILSQVESILPDPKSLLDQLWICIILFLYSVFNGMEFSREATKRRKDSYIERQYTRFKAVYGNTIEEYCHMDVIKVLVYSVMIYENYNRPPVARIAERLWSLVSKKEHTYGIMQVKHFGPIDDKTSVIMAIAKLKADLSEVMSKAKEEEYNIYGLLRSVIEKYNGGYQYQDEVIGIFDKLIESYYPSVKLYIDESASAIKWE